VTCSGRRIMNGIDAVLAVAAAAGAFAPARWDNVL
jgi:hypothetical protein